MFGWLERRRRTRREALERAWAQEYERLMLAGQALQQTTRRIWLEPGYPMLQPINADVDQDLANWVWSPTTLPIAEATRKSLERWAYHRFDGLYKQVLDEPDANADAERVFESDGIVIAQRLQTDLGPDWQVGLFSVKLDRPVWDLDDMPEDEWLYRFEHAPNFDDD